MSLRWGRDLGVPAGVLLASAGRHAPKPHVQVSLALLIPVPAEADKGAPLSRRSNCELFRQGLQVRSGCQPICVPL